MDIPKLIAAQRAYFETGATHDIAADGVIDAKEKPRMEQYLEVLDEITNKAQTLKLIYRKQFGKQEV